KDDREDVQVQNWSAGETIDLDATKGLEVFVVEGSFAEGGEEFSGWDWLRLPPGTQSKAVAGVAGARVWVKSGHLNGMV
ncbi:cupin, partial [Roseibium sp. RKSG952]|nr:cupin [Roseibium sp. RKSG952]